MVLALGSAAVLVPGSPAAQQGRDVVERVRDYIERFEREVSALVAEEHYIQRLETRIGPSATHATRSLRSDYVLVKPADNLAWIGYRDVFDVDGTPVRERDSRIVDILTSTAPDSHERAAAFAFQGARFNLGPVRTVNVPTMPMQLMSRRHAGRVVMRAGRIDRRAGRATVTFFEPNPPTIVRTPDGDDVATRGEVVVRISDGAILGATLRFRFGRRATREEARLTVEYGDVAGIPVPVPLRMIEQHPRVAGVSASGEATYANYRRFQTTSRIR